MFSIRIHSQELLSSEFAVEPTGGSTESLGTSESPNLRLGVLRGVLRLYRDSPLPSFSSSPSSSSPPPPPSSIPHLPAGRGTHLLILAVPGRLSLKDFKLFCGKYIERVNCIRVIRNDAIEDRYSVLMEFDDQKSADGFYRNVNGWEFTSEGEVCHVLFIGSVEFTESTDTAGSTELPTCPVCIERLEQGLRGFSTTNCDNSFQCSRISKWDNSSCSVCQICQKCSDKPTCSICGTSQNLWICMICGFVGCGRYKQGHAERHWKETQHCYSLDLENQRIRDYVGDSYVHMINLSRSDDKLEKLSPIIYPDDNRVGCGCNDKSEKGEVLLCSKIEMIKDEYTHLLASQMESQKQYYETLIQEEKDKKGQFISEAVKRAVNLKMQEIQRQIREVNKEIKTIKAVNKNLEKCRNLWQKQIEEAEERERESLKMKDEKIHDMEEETLDYIFFIGTRKAIDTDEGQNIRDGTVIPKTAPPSSDNANRSSRRSRRRRR